MTIQKNQLLLLEDVDGLGRCGDVVSAKPGFIRNYLLPREMAVYANKHTLRMRSKLQEERAKRAIHDKKEAEELALRINEMKLELEVKVDPDGHMYGSVSSLDLVHLLEKEGIAVERKNFLLPHAIKTLGEHPIPLRLKEGVPATFILKINSDIVIKPLLPAGEEGALPQEESVPKEEGAPEEGGASRE